MKLHKKSLCCAGLALALAGCGGSSYDPGPMTPSNEVPASATASPAAYTTYAASLKASETADPVDVNSAKPPTSETELPLPI